LAGLKFSTSPSILGLFDRVMHRMMAMTKIVVMSLIDSSGLNFILSKFVIVFVGFDDPVSCSIIRWPITMVAISMGSRKCSEKNRFSVG